VAWFLFSQLPLGLVLAPRLVLVVGIPRRGTSPGAITPTITTTPDSSPTPIGLIPPTTTTTTTTTTTRHQHQPPPAPPRFTPTHPHPEPSTTPTTPTTTTTTTTMQNSLRNAMLPRIRLVLAHQAQVPGPLVEGVPARGPVLEVLCHAVDLVDEGDVVVLFCGGEGR
jgi:hypothetical protein